MIDVGDFATGDGVTDDTVGLQAALNYGAPLVRDVLVTEGTFLSGPLTIPAGRRLVYAGGVLKLKAGHPASSFLNFGGDRCAAVGLRIDGNAANQTNPNIGIGIAGRNAATVEGCELWNFTKDAVRASGVCNDLTVVGNFVHDLVAGIATPAGVSILATGARMRVDRNTLNVTTGQALLVHGDPANRVQALSICGNFIDCPGQIPLEVFDATSFTITGNVIVSGNRGITVSRVGDGVIDGNVVKNQTIYAVELNSQTSNVRVAGNVARDCASFLHQTGVVLTDVVIEGNQIIGSGLAAPVAGNYTIKLLSGEHIRIHHNTFRGLGNVPLVIRLGVGATSANVEVTDNEFVFDTPTSGPCAVRVAQAASVKVRGNRATFTRDLAASDDAQRVFAVVQGACSAVSMDDNDVEFRGAVTAAPRLVAVGTADAAAGTLPRSTMRRNRVTDGPIGFRVDATSTDFAFEGNDARSCTTGVGYLNPAIAQ